MIIGTRITEFAVEMGRKVTLGEEERETENEQQQQQL